MAESRKGVNNNVRYNLRSLALLEKFQARSIATYFYCRSFLGAIEAMLELYNLHLKQLAPHPAGVMAK
jgi:hypothetical protein